MEVMAISLDNQEFLLDIEDVLAITEGMLV